MSAVSPAKQRSNSAEAATDEAFDGTIDVMTADGTKSGTVQLPAEVFGVEVNVPLIHQVVVGQLAAARQGTHSTKTRGEVSGGGRKPYRQKGTGRARQGSIRAPQFAGGGVVHGPQPRSYDQRTPKKMKAAALRGALSDRARGGRLHVVNSLVEGDVPSTKHAVEVLSRLAQSRHVLVVVERGDDLTWRSLRNVARVHLLVPDQLNTYDVLISDDVVFTKAALEAFLAGPARGRSAKAVGTGADPEVAAEPVGAKAPVAKSPRAKSAAPDTTTDDAAPSDTAPSDTAASGTSASDATADKPAPRAARKTTAKKAAAAPAESKPADTEPDAPDATNGVSDEAEVGSADEAPDETSEESAK